MQMFAALKQKLTGSVNKFSGRKDFLEAVCASCALVAAADGNIEDEEVEKTIQVIVSNPALSAAFSAREIEGTADTMLKRAQAGRTGRMGLYKEIDDVADDADMAETIYLVALDVADSDGSIADAEKQVLNKIAERLRLDPKKYDI